MKSSSPTTLLLILTMGLLADAQAQESATSAQPASDTELLLHAIEATEPYPATSTPKSGTFYTVQNGESWPPLPGNFMDLPFWDLGNGFYLLDDRAINYVELRAEAAAAEEKESGSYMTMSRNISSSSWGGVYLTNSIATLQTNQTVTETFDIAGGTNFVPYDIWMTTNLSNQISQSQWSWLGIGYTSNSYTFTNQPFEMAFYALAKPQKTMVVGWGNDSVSQCTVPSGLSNAVAVTGGGGQSLALLNDGTVRAWGQNSYGQGTVPTNLVGVAMMASGWYHNVALLTNGTVTAWGLNASSLGWHLTEVPSSLTNATVISAQALHSLALCGDGTVVAWGYNPAGETNIPSGLSNVIAIAAGYQFNLAVKSDGTVTAWGDNASGQCNVPTSLSSVVDVAAGSYHCLALLNNGTVVAWGDNSHGATNVPAGLTNVVGIAASGDAQNATAYSLALKSDGSVVAWGDGEVLNSVGGLSNVIAIGAGADHALAVRSGPPTPVITLQPKDQFQLAGGSVTFTTQGRGLYAVTYQWQFNGTNLNNATNAMLTLTNVQTTQQGIYTVIVSNEVGSITSSNARLYLVTPPSITSQTLPTNRAVIFGENLTLNIAASAFGQSNGFPLFYQWQFNGTNIVGATSSSYTLFGDTNSIGAYSVIVTNAAGSASATWQVTMTYVGSYIDVGTLAYHLSTNAVGRANGFTGSSSDMLMLSGWTDLSHLTNASWSTNCWLKGVQGLSATAMGFLNINSERYVVTMISPQHYLRASHVGNPVGSISFLDTNNAIYTRTFLEEVDIGNDTTAGILNSNLPASIGYLPVIPTNFSNYLPTNNTSYVQGIGVNQDMKVFGQPMTFGDPTYVYWNSRATAPFGLGTNWNILLRRGDSSSPERFLINNQLVLATQHFHSTDGPNLAFQLESINQKMHYLSTNNTVGTDYQLTPFSFTNWPTIH